MDARNTLSVSPVVFLFLSFLSSNSFANFTSTEGVTLWNGLGNNDRWTNNLNWGLRSNPGAPRKSQSWSVSFISFNPLGGMDVDSEVDQNWTLQWIQIEDDVTLNLSSLGGASLTLWEGLVFEEKDNSGGRGQAHNINLPLIFGSTSGGTIQNEQRNSPVNINGTIVNPHTLRLIPTAGSLININGVISGTGSLQKSGDGTAIITNQNIYTGATRVNGGNLVIRDAGRLPDESGLFVNAGILSYQINGEDTVNGLIGGPNGNVFLSSRSHLVIGNQGGDATSGNGSYIGTIDGTGRLSKRGQGILELRGITRLLNQTITVEGGGLELGGTIDVAAPIEVEGGYLTIDPNRDSLFDIDINVSGDGQLRFVNQDGLQLRNVNINSLDGLGELPQEEVIFNTLKFATESGVTTNYVHTQQALRAKELVIGDKGNSTYTQTGDLLISEKIYIAKGLNSVGQYVLDNDPANPGNPRFNTSASSFETFVGDRGAGEVIQNNSLFATQRLSVGTVAIADPGGGGDTPGEGPGGGNTGGNGVPTTSSRYILNDGFLNVSDNLKIGSNRDNPAVNRNGELIQNGGIAAIESIYLGSSNSEFHKGIYQMNGGTVSVDDLTLDKYGIFNLSSGTLDAKNINNNDANFNFTGGILSVDSYQGVLINNGGILSPGNSPGLTNIVGDYIQNQGRVLIEIAGVDSLDIDKINVTGNVQLNGGEVIFAFLDGFLPTKDFTFTFLTSGGLLSIADSLNYEFIGLASGFEYSVANDGSGLTFLALNDGSPVPIPATFWLMLSSILLLGKNYRIRNTP